MITVLVTGSDGFIGKNLCTALTPRKDIILIKYDINNTDNELSDALLKADIIFHLAGVNRPKELSEFNIGNTEFTKHICSFLESAERKPKIILSSSIQAELENPYGLSKKNAELALKDFSDRTGSACVVYRLKNLFGKWCRPNYNSVTATFCHNIANDLPIEISDPLKEIELTYIDDVVSSFISELKTLTVSGFSFAPDVRSYRISLGNLAETIRKFHDIRNSLVLPDISGFFHRALFATLLSYYNPEKCLYNLDIKTDNRGSLAEFIKKDGFGQIFISRTKPGITRGNHYHHTKIEKFMVVQGKAVIKLRCILGSDTIEHLVDGKNYQIVDIPPGYTHSITNIGNDDLVTLFWADEIFNPEKPDTYFEGV